MTTPAAPAGGARVSELGRAARLRLDVAVRAILGENPWPLAGPLGHLSMAVLSITALMLLLGAAAAIWRDQLPHWFVGDFVAYFTGATLLANGETQNLYLPDRQGEVQRVILMNAGYREPGLLPFVNPPLVAAVMAPLTPLGLLVAGQLWRMASLAAAVGALVIVARRNDPGPGWLRSTALLLCFVPFLGSWFGGQVVGFLLAAFGGWLALSRAERPFLAGLVLSAALLKPQYVPVMVIFLAWKRQWTQILGFATGALAQAACTLLLFLPGGPPVALDAVGWHAGLDGQPPIVIEIQVSLHAAVWRLFPGMGIREQLALLAVITALLLAGFLLAIGREWNPRESRFAWEALAATGLSTITAFYNLAGNAYLLLPPAAALLGRRSQSAGHAGAAAVLTLLLALPSLSLVLSSDLDRVYPIAVGATSIGSVVVGVLASRQSTRQ